VLFLGGTARDALMLESMAPLLLVAPVSAPVVELGAQGGIAQLPGATLSAGLLRLRAGGGGAVVLDDPANAVAGLGASAAAGGLTLASGGDLLLVGRVVTPSLRLSARGSIAQTAEAAVEAAFLAVQAQTGEVRLEAAGNQVSLLGAGGTGTGFSLVSATPLLVAGALDAAAGIALAAPSLALDAPMVAPALALHAVAGDLVQGPAGGLATGSLSARAPQGAVRLEAGANAIRALARLEAAGEAQLATLTGLALTGPARAATLRLSAGEGVLQAPDAPITAGRLDVLSARGQVTLGAANAVPVLGEVSAPRGFGLVTGTGLTLLEPLAAPAVALRAGGDIVQSPGGALATASLRAESTGGAVRLDHPGNLVEALGGRAAGDFTLVTGAGLALSAPVSAAGTLALRSGGDIRQAAFGAALSATRLEAAAPFGNLLLDGAGSRFGEVGGATAAGRVALAQAGVLRLSGPVRGAEVLLVGSEGIAGGTVQAGALRLLTPGDAVLVGANEVAALSGAEVLGTLRLASAGPLSLTGPVAAAHAAIEAETLALLAPLAAPGGVALRAGAGGIVQANAGAGLAAGTLHLETTGSVALGGAGNAVAALAGAAVAGDLTLATAGSLRVAGEIGAERLVLRAGDAVRLDGARLGLGTDGLVAAPGGVLAGAGSVLAPRGSGPAPALVLDTRSLGALRALPDHLDASTPLARLGEASPVVAGRIGLALDAGASPVFLLLGGAHAEGTLVAGRLGLLGLGGGASLSGRIGGLGGAAAAGRVEAGGTALGPAYAFNLCAMGHAGCATPPPVVVRPLPRPEAPVGDRPAPPAIRPSPQPARPRPSPVPPVLLPDLAAAPALRAPDPEEER
jgi:filamentous hemagglutinin